MNRKIVTVSIIGLGGRGGEAYGRYMALLKDKFRITHICDINHTRLDKYGKIFEVPEDNRFDEEVERSALYRNARQNARSHG